MSFKIGDRIRYVGNAHWADQWQNSTVVRVDKDAFWFVDDTNPNVVGMEYQTCSHRWALTNPEVAHESSTTNPFLKTVTETRIVDAQTIIGGNFIEVGPNEDGTVSLYVESSSYRKEDVAELARILSEIAEAM